MPEATVVGALRAAAQLIRTRGLAQHVYQSPDGALCAKGAIREALFSSIDSDTARIQAARVLSEQVLGAVRALLPPATVHGNDALVEWNDTPGRTKEEVVAMLEAAADEEERRGEASGDPGGQGEDHHGGGD